MKNLLLITLLSVTLAGTVYSQNNQTEGNPFARYGTKVPVFTFSGRSEFHDTRQIVEIGTVMYDTRTQKIVGFVDTQDTIDYLPPEVIGMQPDPHAEKYYSISPYAYAMNNPIKFVDPDGKDAKDKVVGFGIGLLTNIIPGTGGLRDGYTPTDAPDYNNALRATDNAAVALGNGMVNTGGGGMTAGGTMVVGGLTVTAVSGGTAAVAGVPIAVIGETLVSAGATTAGVGVVLMANGVQNQKDGYDRGKSSGTEGQVNHNDYKHVSPNRIQQLKKEGFDPHGSKPDQGGKGGKIDIYTNKNGDMFYKTQKGNHYEPIDDNINNYK